MIVIIDYGMGNLNSVSKALNKLNKPHRISSDPQALNEATHIILPGVGFFKQGMDNLKKRGFIEAIRKAVLQDKKPLLGICLGMQLLFERSEEGGNVTGLGLIEGEVKRFAIQEKQLKIPHIGWNSIAYNEETLQLFAEVEENSDFYFIHSYHAVTNKEVKKGMTDYGYRFVSTVEKDNIFGTQFHPEKSQKKGLKILENFTNIKKVELC